VVSLPELVLQLRLDEFIVALARGLAFLVCQVFLSCLIDFSLILNLTVFLDLQLIGSADSGTCSQQRLLVRLVPLIRCVWWALHGLDVALGEALQ
jgi:hypothetical protein